MEQLPELPADQPSPPAPEGTDRVVPPKYIKEEAPQQVYMTWLRSFTSLGLYLVLGYYIFHSFTMLLLITTIIVIHELGHFFAMKAFRYKDLGIFFIPLLGAYVSGSKREVSQKESAIILLAGPLPGIIIGIIFYLLWQANDSPYLAGISYYTIALSFIFLNLINLLPIYPLDGGQLLNRIYLDEESWVSKLFVFISIAAMTWFALFKIGYPYGLPLLIFPGLMIIRLFGDRKLNVVEKKVELDGVNLDQAYEDLSDADYWKMRTILVNEHPAYKDVNPDPAAGYHSKEERIMTTIQSLLHRHLIQDVTVIGKVFIFLLCATAFASPWLLDMDMSFFRRFGL